MELPGTALIVDDEEPIRYILTQRLEVMGYESVAVSSGQLALEQLARQQFELVILDVKMPGIGGFEVMKRIRESDANTCVVMVSALGHPDVAARAITSLGADAFIAKPFLLDELQVTIQRAVQQRAHLPPSKRRRMHSRTHSRGLI